MMPMADLALAPRRAKPEMREASTWDRLKHNKNWLGFWFMLPAMAFLILFLAYPLGLGIWLSFTDTKIGRVGEFTQFFRFRATRSLEVRCAVR
jgi:multiple sugar transport system permease protein